MRPELDGQAFELLFDLGEAPAQTVALIPQRFRERHDDLEEQSLAVVDTREGLGFDHLGGSQLHATHDGALAGARWVPIRAFVPLCGFPRHDSAGAVHRLTVWTMGCRTSLQLPRDRVRMRWRRRLDGRRTIREI
jgi:hypothetical protein